ncbi:type VI secretion system baseplate subunit TssF [Taibaiella chishuiensis]|uniref:Uncharacterized protein n=1 Tax=Taibaiella chishuiensis TaxID=1434707 RepID=A0A2P8D818_9BACT|nr:type VI secretion system baseplate subunit TssF [Taibaiella chishuiensis]PSK93348.1 hypothetical protein B0I18_102318 [Taibaiella chishuiensis]
MNTAITNQFTKEAIKARMMQHAANLWGVKSPVSLDPFVRLLIEAFSTEIYRAANETQNIEGRMLDKLSRMLTPNLLTMPRAAHAIMQAQPVEANLNMHPHTHFSVQKRLNALSGGTLRNEEVQINFTPVDHIPLTRGKVACIVNSYQLFEFDAFGFKQPLFRTVNPMPWATCMIGLQLDPAVDNLKDVSLYFDFPAFETSPWVYQLLPLCEVSYNGQPVSITAGRNYAEEQRAPEQEIFQDYDLMHKATTEVKGLYQHKFITLGDCPLQPRPKGILSYPGLVLQSFPEQQLAGKVPGNLVWLEIRFPPNYTYDILGNGYIAINAFPVVNRYLINNTYSYKGLNNILPLRTELHERFMTVQKVSDGHGRQFSEIPFSRSSGHQKGYYSIRHGGAERFDQRAAQDMVGYLLELTRDEVAAFSSLDQTFIRTSLEGLSKQLKQIQNKSEQIDKFIKQAPSYLIVEPYDAEDNIQVEYWVTHGEEANNIRTGTEFRCQNSPDIAAQGIILLSETRGGREQLQAGERLDACRFALGSRDRLITQEDIRNFCRAELGKKLRDVRFRKGLSPSPHPSQGYIRTLDIILVPYNYTEFNEAEWNHIAQSLFIKIKNNSADNNNYRMVVETPVIQGS